MTKSPRQSDIISDGEVNNTMKPQLFSMVVIDDVRAVVKGIANDSMWSDCGVTVSGAAYNGEEGAELIRRLKPDIIVTDIRMPKLGGIDMIRELLDFLPQAKIIFISGYSDFEYAQQAIQLGAFDYILKPFTPQQLADVVKKAVHQLTAERNLKNKVNDMERRLLESMPLLRQEYLNLLIRYTGQTEGLQQRWDFLGIDMDTDRLVVMVMEMNQLPRQDEAILVSEAELQRFAVQNIVEETILESTKGVVFRESINRLAAVVNPAPTETVEALAERCREHVQIYSKNTLSIGVSNMVSDLAKLTAAYRQALESLAYTFYSGGNSVFAYSHINIKRRPGAFFIHPATDWEKELTYAIRSGNSAQAERCLLELPGECGEELPSPSGTKISYMNVAAVILKASPEFDNTKDGEQTDELLRRLSAPEATLHQLHEALVQLCRHCCGKVNSQIQTTAQETVQTVIRFIQANLHLDLQISDYAKHVHLSTSYFSNLFRKVTGMSVLQFVIQEKMEKAKLLLLNGKSIGEIAELLGYEERSYFSDVFKRQTGVTPTEYRQPLRQERVPYED